MPSRSLAGSTVLVAGASGGLGAPIVAELATRGARIVAFVRHPERVAPGPHLIDTVAGDLAVAADVARAVARAAALGGGRIDGVVNAAGVVAFGMLGDLDDATLERLFAVNTLGPLRLVRDALPHLADGGFVAHVSAVVAEQPVAGMAAYSASKAALTAADVAIARELRRRRITVLDARPPHTETGLATRPIAGAAPSLPHGQDPAAVAARIVAAIEADERELPSSAFA